MSSIAVHATFSYLFSPQTTARTITLSVAKTGYKTVAASFVQNDDLYYMIGTDGIYPQLSVAENGAVQIMGMNKVLTTSANRTIKVICTYVKN